MKQSRLTLIVIIILILLAGGWVYADKAKQQAVDDAVSEALSENAMMLDMLGLQLQYADLDTSLFTNAVTFQDITITRRLSSAGVSGAQETTIDALTVDQNLPLVELDEAVDESRIPTEFSLAIEGLDLTSAVEAMQQDVNLSPAFKNVLQTAIEARQKDTALKSDMQFAYQLDAGRRGESDRLNLDFSVVLRDMGEIRLESKFQEVNTQLFALLNLANTAQVQQLDFVYDGNAELNKAVMVTLARETGADVDDYSEVAERLIADLKPTTLDEDSWQSRELRPTAEVFINHPKRLEIHVKPTTPMTLNELLQRFEYRDKAVLDGITLKAN